MSLLFMLAACRLGSDPLAEDALVPVPTEPGQTARILAELSPGMPTAYATHADPSGVWAIVWTGDGYGLDLRPEEGHGYELFRLSGDEQGEVVRLPGPPLVEQPGVVVREYERLLFDFLPSVTPGHLAFRHGSRIYRFDGADWTVEEVFPSGVLDLPSLGVGPERAAFVDGANLKLVQAGQVDERYTLPGWDPFVYPEVAWGPFDGEGLRVAWIHEGELCTARLDLVGDTLQGQTCLDLEAPITFRSALAGTPEKAHVVVSSDPPEVDKYLLVAASDAGVEVLGRMSTAATDVVHDDPQTDFLTFARDEVGSIPDQMILADGSFDWVRTPPGSLQPAAECPCEENDPTVCWCIPRTLPSRSSVQVAPRSHWEVAVEVHDAKRYVWADYFTDPHVETTADPTLELLPFALDDLRLSLVPVVSAPGYEGYVDLNTCRTVTDSSGATVLPGASGAYPFDAYETLTVDYDGCLPPDGGPPLLPLTATDRGNTDVFTLLGVSLGRGWPVDPLDDPPEVVARAGIPLLLVRETTGWTLFQQDGASIARATVDGPDAAAPRILLDGRVLLQSGDVYDPATNAVWNDVPLGVEPSLVRELHGFLVEDGPDRLRIHDLSGAAPLLVLDEPGVRTAELLDLSPDGPTLLETDGTTVWVRRNGLQASLGGVSVGLRRALLSEDGSIAVVGLQTSSTNPQQSSLSAWGLDDSMGLVATERVLCTACEPQWAFDRASGAVLGPRNGGTLEALDLHRPNTEAPGTPAWAWTSTPVDTGALYAVGDSTTDAHGWAWYRRGTELVGFDFGTATSTVQTGFLPVQPGFMATDPVREQAGAIGWLLDDGGTWHQLVGAGVWQASHGQVYDDPVPVSGGRAVQALLGMNAFHAGVWSPGELQLTDSVEVAPFQPEMLAEKAEPVYSAVPCVLYALEVQPAWVDASPWACVR